MPIYEYRCLQCNHQLEVIQKFSELPLTNCPNCGKNSLEKIISSTAFQLKGTGWYATDFKNSGKEKKDTSTTSAGSNETKSDPSSSSEKQD